MDEERRLLECHTNGLDKSSIRMALKHIRNEIMKFGELSVSESVVAIVAKRNACETLPKMLVVQDALESFEYQLESTSPPAGSPCGSTMIPSLDSPKYAKSFFLTSSLTLLQWRYQGRRRREECVRHRQGIKELLRQENRRRSPHLLPRSSSTTSVPSPPSNV